MASGFITLQNGEDWSCRWSGYDRVLEAIMKALPTDHEAMVLRDWMAYILPNEEAGDIESGFAFIKATEGQESILRTIDTRCMKEQYRALFWSAVTALQPKLHEFDQYLQLAIKSLFEMYSQSLQEDYQEAEDNISHDIFFVGDFKIGTKKSG
ncbi:MAG: hypothetical protein AB8F95_15745 [Bacteroidia bacterium]